MQHIHNIYHVRLVPLQPYIMRWAKWKSIAYRWHLHTINTTRTHTHSRVDNKESTCARAVIHEIARDTRACNIRTCFGADSKIYTVMCLQLGRHLFPRCCQRNGDINPANRNISTKHRLNSSIKHTVFGDGKWPVISHRRESMGTIFGTCPRIHHHYSSRRPELMGLTAADSPTR